MTRIHKLLVPLAAAALGLAPGVRAETTEDLAAKVKKLEAELDAVKKAVARQAPAAEAKAADAKPAEQGVSERLDLLEVKQNDAVVKGDIPGSFRIPGSEMSLRLYGYAEMNWIHELNNDNADNDYSTFPAYLPLQNSTQARSGGRNYFTARESRLGLEAGMPTRYGVMGVKIEGDFNNEPRTGNSAVYGSKYNVYTQQATNSYGFRLRHAYGSFAGLLVGQTWSTFMDADNFPETVDYNGPVGATFIRQPQIRYTYGTQSAGSFTAAVENSVTYVLADDDTVARSHARIPDVVVRWDKGWEKVAVSVRAMTQQYRLVGGGTNATSQGWGVATSGSFKVRDGKDLLTWGATYGKGIGRYLNYIEGAAYRADTEHILLEEAIGGYVGYQLKVSDKLRFNFTEGITYTFDNEYTRFAKAQGNDGSAPDLEDARYGVNRWTDQAHAGFFLTPVPSTDFGFEAIYSARKTLSGRTGQELRLNLLARYYINY